MRVPFVHLHCHSVYSLHDGAARLEELVGHAARLRFTALALTDHGNMYGAATFFHKALAAGIKPILGCELYVKAGGPPDPSADETESIYLYHQPLLVTDHTGYGNLCRLLSLAKYLPSAAVQYVSLADLHRCSKGLIAFSGCLRGHIPRLLLADRFEEALEMAGQYREAFGKENYFIELQFHGKEEEKRYIPHLLDISRRTGLQLVATNDAHFARPADFHRQELMIAIAQDRRLRRVDGGLDEPAGYELDGNHYTSAHHLRPHEEMVMIFAGHPEAVRATVSIADRCNFRLDDVVCARPRFSPPAGETEDGMLAGLARAGIAALQKTGDAYAARLDAELNSISERRMAGYFLIIRDIVMSGRAGGLQCGAGGRLAGSSLVAHAIGIADVDPVEHDIPFDPNVPFERGLHPAVDVSLEGRGALARHVFEQQGEERTAHVIEIGQLQTRSAIRESARAYGLEPDEIDRLLSRIPAGSHIPRIAGLGVAAQASIDGAREIDGLPHHTIAHGSLVLSSEPLWEKLPVTHGSDGHLIAHFPHYELDRLGALRVEFSGNRAMAIERRVGVEVPRSFEDSDAFDLIARKQTLGVLPLDTPAYRSILLVPRTFGELIVVLAIGRLLTHREEVALRIQAGILEGREAPEQFPELATALASTGGYLLFQEHVDAILRLFTDGSVKRSEIMSAVERPDAGPSDALLARFKKAARRRGLKRRTTALFEMLLDAAPHLVSKASVAAQAIQTYRLAWLKAHQPVRFMAALLNSYSEDAPEVEGILEECLRMGVRLMPVDINESAEECVALDDAVRLGLNVVAGLGDHATRAILEVRRQLGGFKTFCDYLFSVDAHHVHQRGHDALIKSGAFDSLGLGRRALVEALPRLLELKHSRERVAGQSRLFELERADAEALEDIIRQQTLEIRRR